MTPLAEMYPNYNPPHYGLAMAYEQKREWDKAIPEMERANQIEMTQDGLAQLGHMYAVSGRTADARRVLRQLIEMSHKRYVSPYNIGVLYVGLGDIDQAFRWLQKVDEDRSDWFLCVNVDPRLEALHSDPRWAGILRSVGFGK